MCGLRGTAYASLRLPLNTALDVSMDKAETLRYFESQNDPESWGYPSNFDYQGQSERAKRFHEQLSDLLESKFCYESGANIQDASFHSQIYLNGGLLRFSNFGDMVAITPEHDVDDQVVSAIETLCEEMKFVFVESEFAELAYTGKNLGVTGIDSWWVRYFDWV